MVDRNGSPWALLTEISSSGNVSTVDVVYRCWTTRSTAAGR
nr:hypothetical protein [Amycolatopsis rubida]